MSESIRAALSGPGVEFHTLGRRQLRTHLSTLRHPHEVLLVDAAWMTPAMLRAHRGSPAPQHLILIGGSGADCALPAVALPLRRAALRRAVWQLSAPACAPETAPQRRSLGLRVLVAEDNRVNARLACLLLESFGCTYTVAANGREAVDAFRRQPFDAILMDCQMPIMDGHAATRKIRQLERQCGTHCKIIAMTASALPEERERCIASGMDDYLTKPFDTDTLEALLADLVHPVPAATAPAAPQPAPENATAAALNRLASQLGSQEARQIAAIWLEEAPGRLSRLQQALGQSDWAAAGREAHALRGASALFGMSAVAENSTALEAAARSGHPVPDDCVRKLLASVHQAMADLRHAL